MFTYSYAGVQLWGSSPRTSRYSESKTIDTKEHENRQRSRRSRNPRTSVLSRIRRERSRSPSYSQNSHSKYTEALSESEDSEGGHWKSRSKKKKSYREEDDLSQPWVCEEVDPFTPRIRYFDFPKTRMPSHIKTYDGSKDPKDHLKIFQAAAKIERWAMPTWCHMFNSTLTGNARVWFDDLPPESIDSYDDLKKAFLENYLQQKKCIKDPIEIHNIKQREGESTEDFVKRYKLESRDVKGAPECMRISGFVHGITKPELIKRLHDKIPKTVDEMMRVTTSFLRGEVVASNHERKKTFPPWKQHEGSQKQNFKKGGFRNQQRSERKHDRFSLLTKTPKEIFTLDKGKFKAPPPMTTPVEKRNHAKFCEFHSEVGHNTDECMHLKDKALSILMVQPWERVARQRITQSFSLNPEVFFPPLGEDKGTEGPMTIEAKIGGHCVHRMYIGDEEHSASAWMNFMVVRSSSPYNGIIGRPGVRKLQAVPSTTHEMLKIPVEGGVITLKSSKLVPLECVVVSGPKGAPSATKPIIEERIKKPADMTGVPRHIAEHRLNVREGCSLVRQKKRRQAADRNQAIQEEVRKLMEVGIMKEVHYHDWLSNPVMVKKHDDSWRMCVNFKDLNNACPKDGYPLPEIDWKVESLNAGATYQRLVDKAFHKQIGRKKYKVDVVLSLPSPKCLKDVQKLNGKLASLNRFLAKSKEKSLPFFKALKKCTKKSDFHWTTEAEEAFKQMKQLIAELPMLMAPMEKKELIVYLAAAKETVSAVLMTEREAKQMPIYFVSRALRGPELNYTSMEKLVLTLVHASKRLKRPRVSVKGQILADFIVERPEEDSSDTPMEEEEELPEPWILFIDRSSCTDGSGAGLILTNPEGIEFTYALRFRFDATNNEAEYEALIAGLRIAEQIGVKNLQANMDSCLVANQVNETYVAKEADMVRYLEKVKALTGGFKAFTIKKIPKSKDKKADALSKITSTSFAHLSKQVLVKELKEKSISKVEVLTVVEEEGGTWMTPIYKYLAEETLPADMKKARAIKRKSWRFTVTNGILYKKSFLSPWLRCVGPVQANYVLREIHEGSCSMHAGTRSVVAKSLRTWYYWPTMHGDARTVIRAFQYSHVHKPILRNPQQKLTPITSPWPFYKWGIDIAGPFPEGTGKVTFLIVAMDYFTKWIEAKPVATITGNQIKKFTWDNIVYRFELPREIISDNGKQFRDDPFKDWCEKLCINQHFASVKHLQTNGLIERANHSLGEGIKASNGDTPFSLTYETEAVIPAEIGMPTIRTAEVDLVQNNEALEINLDLLEERREEAAIREAKSKAKMEKYYNAKVRNTSFKPEDLVYRNNDASRAEDIGKLGPK
ncbi:reverse transcriptase domain-containing protein [Tanacetum coccineum]